MSTIKYEFGAIAAAASDINAASGRITALLSDLKATITPMTSTWEGEAAAAYVEAQAKWDRAFEELNTVLGTIATTVGETNDRMADVNRRAAASWA